MAKTNTGADPWLGVAGAGRVQEMLRTGFTVHREMTSEPGNLTTADILRQQLTVAGDPSAGLKPTFSSVAGLTDIAVSLEQPDAWNKRLAPGAVPLKTNERMVYLRDVPATANERADVVLLTDRFQFDDPIYGAGKIWSVKSVRVLTDAARLMRVRVQYANQE